MRDVIDLPTDPKKLRVRLRRYERQMREEKREHGSIGDGSGNRYLLGPLYMLLGDLDGALRSFDWFDEEFPDDSLMPDQCLCWALAHLRNRDEPRARFKLRAAMLGNLFLIPSFLGAPIEELDIWHSSNLADPSYLEWVPAAYFTIWSATERQWADDTYQDAELVEVRTRYIDIYRELKTLAPGPRRTRIVQEASALRHPRKEGLNLRSV